MPEMVLLADGRAIPWRRKNAQPRAIVAGQMSNRPADKVPQLSITDPLNAGDFS
jgi:hypothetical protein